MLCVSFTSIGCVARTVNSPNQHLLRTDDVISCCLDLSAPSISFRINGQPVQGMFENFNIDGLFFPVVSFSAGIKLASCVISFLPSLVFVFVVFLGVGWFLYMWVHWIITGCLWPHFPFWHLLLWHTSSSWIMRATKESWKDSASIVFQHNIVFQGFRWFADRP